MQPRIKKILKWTAALVGVAVIVAVGVFGHGLYQFYRYGPWGLGKIVYTSDMEEIRPEYNGISFAIPKAYMWSRESRDVKDRLNLKFHAHLPKFDPVTSANRSDFAEIAEPKIINFVLIAYSRGEYDSDLMRQQQSFDKNAPQGEFSGLTRYYEIDPSRRTEFYLGTTERGLHILQCRRIENEPYPTCDAHLLVGDLIRVDYTFNKLQLSNWREIDSGLRALVQSFIDNAAARPQGGIK